MSVELWVALDYYQRNPDLNLTGIICHVFANPWKQNHEQYRALFLNLLKFSQLHPEYEEYFTMPLILDGFKVRDESYDNFRKRSTDRYLTSREKFDAFVSCFFAPSPEKKRDPGLLEDFIVEKDYDSDSDDEDFIEEDGLDFIINSEKINKKDDTNDKPPHK